jgi:hypothetical protein
MRNQTGYSISRGVAIAAAASALLGLAAVAPTLQAAPGSAPPDAEAPLILAATEGMERRDDRRDDRKDDRGDRRDTRQDCRDEGGLAGKDKRDCKQEGREERGSDEG